MKSNQNEFKIESKWIEIKLSSKSAIFNQFLTKIAQNRDKSGTKIKIMDLGSGVIKSTQIGQFPTKKWDKNKNNGFGLEQPNLIIKLANFERKSMKNQWKLNEISGKIITNF